MIFRTFLSVNLTNCMFHYIRVPALADTRWVDYCFWHLKTKSTLKSKLYFRLYADVNFLPFRGLLFFKQSLGYTPNDIGQRFHFFVDKDFSYLEVSFDILINLLGSSCDIPTHPAPLLCSPVPLPSDEQVPSIQHLSPSRTSCPCNTNGTC